MNRHVLVSLLKSVVLLDIMEIITSHHHGSVHLHLGDHSGQNTSTDGNLINYYQETCFHKIFINYLASKGALFVNIASALGFVGDFESKTGVAEEPGFGGFQTSLLVQEDSWLLLEGPLRLIGHDFI